MAYDGGKLTLIYEMAPGADPDGDQDDWNWVEILDPLDPTRSLVYSPKSGPEVTIRAGRSSASGTADPTTMTFTVLNLHGEWTHPEGAYYAALVQGLPFRVTLSLDGTDYPRGTAFLATAKPRWDSTLKHSVIDITCRGTLWRVSRDRQVLKSAAYRTVQRLTKLVGTPVAHWPMERNASSTAFPSAIPTGTAATYTDVTPGGSTDIVGSDTAALLTETSRIVAPTPDATSTGMWTAFWSYLIPTEPAAATKIFEIRSTSPLVTWRVFLEPGGVMRLTTYDSADSTLATKTASISVAKMYGHPTAFSLTAAADGSNTDYVLWAMYTVDASGDGIIDTVAVAHSAPPVMFVEAAPGLDGAATCHWALHTGAFVSSSGTLSVDADIVLRQYMDGIRGHLREFPYARFARLCAEEGLNYTIEDTDLGGPRMGPQGVDTLATLLAECETASGLVMHDAGTDGTRGGLLFFPAKGHRTNRATDLTLSMQPGSGQVSPGIEPSLDDQLLVNSVNVTRKSGGSSVVVTDEASIALRGTRDQRVVVNAEDDTRLADVGGLRLALGAQSGFRFPTVAWNLRNPNTTVLAEDWLACAINARLVITDPPSQYPPDNIATTLDGYVEELGTYHWVVRGNLAADIWRVGTLGNIPVSTNSLIGRADAVVVLAGTPSTTDTAILITTTDSLVTTDSSDYPYDVAVAGERWTATGCTGATNPQTLTVTRSVNGVVKAHAAGTPVTLILPLRMIM